MKVVFFTIVLNGMPFLRHHYEMMRRLSLDWQWIVVEGVASLTHDTGWGLSRGAKINPSLHRAGLSVDGTTELLNELAQADPQRVLVRRPEPGAFWDGKQAMVNAVLEGLNEECLLWEIDADELWAKRQVELVHQKFLEDPTRTAAFFRCNYFVGRFFQVISENTYGNYSNEWLRLWRYRPGMRWARHEPPVLVQKSATTQEEKDVAYLRPFKRRETESWGVAFQHFAYVEEKQLAFKEDYYGYRGAVQAWQRLNATKKKRVELGQYWDWVAEADHSRLTKKEKKWRKFFPWVGRRTIVERTTIDQVQNLARVDAAGEWHFVPDFIEPHVNDPRRILFVRTDNIGDNVLFLPVMRAFRKRFPAAQIMIACSAQSAEIWQACEDVDVVRPFAYMRPYKGLRPFAGGRLFRELLAELRAFRPNWAINPQYSRTRLSDQLVLGCGARRTIGFAGAKAKISKKEHRQASERYRDLIALPTDPRHETEVGEALARLCQVPVEVQAHGYRARPEDLEQVQHLLAPLRAIKGKRVALFACTSEFPKNYRFFGEVLRQLQTEQDVTVVALGDRTSCAINEEALQGLSGTHLNLSGRTTIREAAAILSTCDLALGSDTSHAHLAGLQGVPTVVVAGAAYGARFFSTQPSVTTVTLPLDCAGCGWECRGHHYVCVQGVRPSTVLEAVKARLSQPTGGKASVLAQTILPWPQDLEGSPQWLNLKNLVDGNLLTVNESVKPIA